ncbi:hypothetical protein [Streptosporangium sp. CA-115845]|uniref:hypothetical protein n=1 Tax=Streptosporangium sp. CA-115845 TaxID=3240071 RepID=UPI003D932DB1
MDQRVMLLAPDHVSDELGGSYQDACKVLDLEPIPGGYAVYLMDTMNHRTTVIYADTGPVRQAKQNFEGGGDGDLSATLNLGDILDIRIGWPEELGGGPRCQFCRHTDPAWLYEGAEVEVLLGEPLFGVGPPQVIGTDVVGCMDWYACSDCYELIQAADQGSWHRLLDRYGSHDVPMPVQAAWREFWLNHRRPTPAPPPAWTPARRRALANHIRLHWDDWVARYPLDDVVFISEPGTPELAGVNRALAAARAYLDRPPQPGRIRSYPAGLASIVRADGDDWSLIGRTDAHAIILLDDVPDVLHPLKGPRTTSLLHGLKELLPHLTTE